MNSKNSRFEWTEISKKYYYGMAVYFKDQLSVGNIKSSVGIATLWTPKEKLTGILQSVIILLRVRK